MTNIPTAIARHSGGACRGWGAAVFEDFAAMSYTFLFSILGMTSMYQNPGHLESNERHNRWQKLKRRRMGGASCCPYCRCY